MRIAPVTNAKKQIIEHTKKLISIDEYLDCKDCVFIKNEKKLLEKKLNEFTTPLAKNKGAYHGNTSKW